MSRMNSMDDIYAKLTKEQIEEIEENLQELMLHRKYLKMESGRNRPYYQMYCMESRKYSNIQRTGQDEY